MKRYLLTITIPAIVFLLPSVVRAEDATTDGQITALGRQGGHHGWLSTAGPDRDGRYVLRIGVADLDLTTASGWAQMRSRVQTGTGQLCHKAGALPLAGGRHNQAQRECWDETRSQALTQMQQARDAAMGGRRITGLRLQMRPLAR